MFSGNVDDKFPFVPEGKRRESLIKFNYLTIISLINSKAKYCKIDGVRELIQ